PCCGGKVLAHDKPYRVHQVFDLPEVSYFVTEHQLFRATCTHCINTTETRLPETVSDTQMGANLLSYIALQSGQFHQSVSQIQQQLKQHFGLGFSRGAISEAQGRVSTMLTNNEAERALRGYVLWRKGSYGVCSHRGELFRQRLLSLVETAKRLGRCPQEWLRTVVRACIEKTDYPIPTELCASSPCR
ncbi:MAG: IS66 family transposase zinc-finger binding domain-containing protein, partial [Aeromonas veronii]